MKYIIDHPSWQEACNGIWCGLCTLADEKNGECKIRNYIQKQPVYEEQPHGEWIPCSERLPEERGYYLVTTDGSHNDVIDIAEYGIYKNLVWGWNKASKIIAWMPLPEPYKERGEAE